MKHLAVATVMATVFSIGAAHADTDNTIAHRRGIMAAIGGNFSASLAILKGEQRFAGDRQFHAETIVRLAEIAEQGYPAGSDAGKTKAKSDIWEQPDVFAEEMLQFQDKAKALAKVASSDDIRAYAGAIKDLGGSCKSCHDQFKAD